MQKTMKATIVEGGVRGWVTHPQTASGTSAQCCRSAGSDRVALGTYRIPAERRPEIALALGIDTGVR